MTSHNNQANTAVPAAVIRLLAEAMGAPTEAIAPTYGGFSNLSFFATFGDIRCVVKAASSPIKRSDVRREASVLAALEGTGINAPRLLRVVEDEHWTIAVTQARAGRNGLRVLAETPAELGLLFAALGSALGRVHVALAKPSADLSLASRIEDAAAILPNLPIQEETQVELGASLRHSIWHSSIPHLVHGDVGLHNVVWDGESLLLLDWEWTSLGQPLLDLAWLRWTIRWRNLDDALWDAAIRTYQQTAGGLETTSIDDIRALMLGQIAMILARVRDQPAAFGEWLRRAEWTLTLPDSAARF